MVNFFDSIQVLPGLNANGSLTLGENIADHGGMQVSFQAFKNATKDAPLPVEDGFTPEQRSSCHTPECGLAISATSRFVCKQSLIHIHWADGV